jgi:hypothetical protein
MLHNQGGSGADIVDVAIGGRDIAMGSEVVVKHFNGLQLRQIQPFGSFTDAIAVLCIDDRDRSYRFGIYRSAFDERIFIAVEPQESFDAGMRTARKDDTGTRSQAG